MLFRSKAATIILAEGTSNKITDNANNTSKGALMSKTKIIFSEEGNGTLDVTGNSKHAIFSNDYVRVDGGKINILSSQSDGIHADYFIMNGGELNISDTQGDGIDGDNGYIEINDGKLTINSSADDIKGLKCDSIITINGGEINITLAGAASKGIKNSIDGVIINDGNSTFNLLGDMLYEPGEYYYTAAITSAKNITINGGTVTVNNTTK